MTKDLRATLDELGPDYEALVRRLKKAPGYAPRRPAWRAFLAAASVGGVLLAAGLFAFRPKGASPRYGAKEYHLTAREMIETQRADGGWGNDFLTRRNAETLRTLADPRAQIAYKKALRNLRFREQGRF